MSAERSLSRPAGHLVARLNQAAVSLLNVVGLRAASCGRKRLRRSRLRPRALLGGGFEGVVALA